MAAGADTLSRKNPSSARQLPILAALYARSPTLFESIIHHRSDFVNPFLHFLGKNRGNYTQMFWCCEQNRGSFVENDEKPLQIIGKYT